MGCGGSLPTRNTLSPPYESLRGSEGLLSCAYRQRATFLRGRRSDRSRECPPISSCAELSAYRQSAILSVYSNTSPLPKKH